MRPVHYHATGARGFRFECYQVEIRAHVASARTIPAPRRHTDLRRVTCRGCWEEIGKLSDFARGKIAAGRLMVE